ncbi:MAG TPA: hypothetical protein PKH81_07930 [Treponemataceae bacterium]|nr:hypothetical protein [Treponemataceae bacterium]
MKKAMFVVLLVSTLFCSLAAFAQSADEFVVQSVTGKVEREVSAGKWEAVEKGMKLAPSTVINTGLNSSLTLNTGDSKVTVKAMQKGTVEKLTSAVASKKSGVKIGAKATKSSAAEEGGPARTNVSTASTRASDATGDLEWAE